jgi:HK97 family phage prohead protease/HK97 family phage major capsid protein
MPMKPRTGESQDDFMARCMHETYGSDAPADRTQDQAVAICMSYWRAERGGKPPSNKFNRQQEVQRIIARFKNSSAILQRLAQDDLPYPEKGDDYDGFMERCMGDVSDDEDPDVIEDLCDKQWEDAVDEGIVGDDDSGEESLRNNGLMHKTHSEPIIGGNFVLSDESIDRMGEVLVAEGWQLDNFRKNPIALFNHRSDFVIGRWHDLAIKDGKLNGRLELARKGTSERIDEIRSLVDAGILRAVSVGFQSKKKEPMDEKSDSFFGPFRYLKQELIECSLVSVPANPNALAVAKSLNISPATLDTVFARLGKRERTIRRGINGGSARRNGAGRRTNMTLAQRITDIQAQIIVKRDALQAHLEKMDDSNVSDADLDATTTMNDEIKQLERTRLALVDSEKNLAASLENADRSNRSRLPTIVPAATPHHGSNGNGNGNNGVITSTIGKKDLDLLDYLVRGGTVAYVSKQWGKDPHQTRQQIYGDDEGTKAFVDLVLRTASAPAMTTVTGWAAELVQQIYTAMMPLLMPKAVLTRLAARGLSLTFGRAGKINIPTRSRTPSIAGSFVGEGQAIPVRQGAFTSQALTPKKMAVITTWTREMDEHSIPAIEGVLRDAIQTDTTVAVDSVLLDANPATLIRPAGLLNGVAALTATAGGGLTALVGDLKILIGALSTATFGNVRDPVFLMNQVDMLSISLVNAPNTGIFPFKEEIARGTLLNIPVIDSATVPVKTVVLVDAADFVVADGGAPRFELSDQATLHMEDTAPADLVGVGSPGAVASPQRSLFQTDSIALRMVMPLNWLQRRAGTVAWVQNVTW